ncbi:MAG: bifunctional UDP-N-acetylglucosamine pyrophosphorylase / glucosamine-phosphate N-acetyltransferase [Alphaproteobacteria bacterium]|jgi:bifunctional UDP-N-acetylglucosamine pyrophosphorylase/glucosamine-1-phosphate N-acetyltransferase|nr:bifunctional UDP-N-acetylglucosamine pyrophosphorylase / glucosamine-phosphate N-acetyltransferase [Alphaproteobacteria bacterium]
MDDRSCLAVVLAAGEGTRMRSQRAKVLHEIAGQSLLAHVLAAVRAAGGTATAVVVGPDAAPVAAAAQRVIPDADIFVQSERRGTAHAVLAAKSAIARGADDVLVIFADTPLIRPQTLGRMRAALAGGAAVVVLGFRPRDPTGYGRLVLDGGELTAIREELDASETERAITLCNGGLMAFAGATALAILERIGSDNRKGEYYLTDAVATARAMKLKAVAIETEEDDVRGINTKAQLAETEAVLQQRLRQAALEAGVTLVAPETVFLSADTQFGRDVVVEPYVVFGPGVTVEDDAVIRSFSHLDRAHVGKGSLVGPYARLRPGAYLEANVHIGNFVEVKEAVIEAGAKANHLAYIGDARLGAGANFGAGAIVCNYDGVTKHRTDIGKGAFIGSNAALVAPVTVGDGAYVATGSVITQDVPADALAIGRSRQVVKENRAARLRAAKAAGHKKAAE